MFSLLILLALVDCLARQDFVLWLEEPGNTQRLVAQLLGVSQSLVSSWKSTGGSRPAPHLRAPLEVLTGIGAARWTTAEEQESARKAMIAAEAEAERRRRTGVA